MSVRQGEYTYEIPYPYSFSVKLKVSMDGHNYETHNVNAQIRYQSGDSVKKNMLRLYGNIIHLFLIISR